MNKMKRNTLIITILGLLLTANMLFAQRGPGGPPPIPSEKQVAAMVNELSNTLSLSTSQKNNVSVLYNAHFDEIRDKSTSSVNAQRMSRQAMESKRSGFEADVKAFLNADQLKLFEAYLENNRPSDPPQRGRR